MKKRSPFFSRVHTRRLISSILFVVMALTGMTSGVSALNFVDLASGNFANTPAPEQIRVNCGSVEGIGTGNYGTYYSYLPEEHLHTNSGSTASMEDKTTKRSATYGNSFTYRLPMAADATAPLYLSLEYRGQVKMTVTGAADPLLDVKTDVRMTAAQFTLTDASLWANGYVEVKIEAAVTGGTAHVVWIELGKTSPYIERLRHVVWDTKDMLWQVGLYDGTNREFTGAKKTDFTVGIDDPKDIATTGGILVRWNQAAINPDSQYWLLTGVIGGNNNIIDMGNTGTPDIQRSGLREVIYDLDITEMIAVGSNSVKLQLNGQLDFIALVEAEPGFTKDEDLRVVFKGSRMAEDWTKLANNTMYYSNELFFNNNSGFIDASPPNGIFRNQFWMADAAPMMLEMAKWGYFDYAKQASGFIKLIDVNSNNGFHDNGAVGLWLSTITYLMKSDNYQGSYTTQMYNVLKSGMDYFDAQSNNQLNLIRGNNVETTNRDYGIYNNSIAYFSLLAGAEAAREIGNTDDAVRWEGAAARILNGIQTHLVAKEDRYTTAGNVVPKDTFIYSIPNTTSMFTSPHAGWFGVGVQESQYYGYRGDAVDWLRSGVNKMLKTHPGLYWDDWEIYGHNRGFGTTYGVLSERGGWPLNSMFMSDEMDMAKKNLQHIIYNSTDLYFENDNEGVAEISPWVLVREVSKNDHGITGADIGNGGEVEDLNLVEFAVTMTNVRIMTGIDDSLQNSNLTIIPRIPREWGGAKVNAYPALYKDGSEYKRTAITYDYDFTRNGSVMTVSSEAAISGVEMRFGPFDKGLTQAQVSSVSIDGVSGQAFTVEDRGDSSWVWVTADVGTTPKTITVTLDIGDVLLNDRFDAGMADWSAIAGMWDVSNGRLTIEDGLLLNQKTSIDFDGCAFSADVTLNKATSKAGIVVGADSSGAGGYALVLDKNIGDEGEIAIINRTTDEKIFSRPMNVCLGRAYNLKLLTTKEGVLPVLDGVRVGIVAHGITLDQGSLGFIAAGGARFGNAYARACEVTMPQAEALDLRMEIVSTDTATIMTNHPVKLLANLRYSDGATELVDAKALNFHTDDDALFEVVDGKVIAKAWGSGKIWATIDLPNGDEFKSSELSLTAHLLPTETTQLLQTDFSSNSTGWTTYGGSSRIEDGKLIASNNGDSWTLYQNLSVKNFVMSADLTLISGNAVGLSFRVPDAGNSGGYDVILDQVDGRIKLCRRPYHVLSDLSMRVATGETYHLTVHAADQTFTVFLNGIKVMQYTDNLAGVSNSQRYSSAGKVGLFAYRSQVSADYIRVEAESLSLTASYSPLITGIPGKLLLKHASSAGGDMELIDPEDLGITLTSSDPSVAEISGTDILPKKAGLVTITAENADGSLKASPLKLKVEAFDELIIMEKLAAENNPDIPSEAISDGATFPVGLNVNTSLNIQLTDGRLVEIRAYPNLTLTYESSNPDVASYENGVLITKKPGKTEILIKLDIDGGESFESDPVNIICFDPSLLEDAYFTGDVTLSDWENPTFGGNSVWSASDGAMTVTSADVGDNWYIYKPATATDFVYSADITLDSENTSVGLCFRMPQSGNPEGGYDIVLESLPGLPSRLGMHSRPYGAGSMLGNYHFTPTIGQTYNVTIIAKGNNFKVYLDGILRLNITHNTYASGRFGVFYYRHGDAAPAAGTIENLVMSPIPQGEISEPGKTRADLQALIAEAENLVEQDYTPETWADFAVALADAKAVLADEDADQKTINDAWDVLDTSMKALKEVDGGEEIPVSKIKINASGLFTLSVKKKAQIPVTVEPEDATDQTVKWISTNPNIFTVDADGTITPHKQGTATLTAQSSNGLKSTIIVRITA